MSRRDEVLRALRESRTAGVSGEQLGHELGISRVAVAKHIAALREEGYAIEARPGEGYRLLSAPALLLPAEVVPLLTHPLWGDVSGGLETGSTNEDARGLARGGSPEGTLVVAARQTGGRGRLGRSWESPAGGAYLSAVLRPRVAPAEVATLGLALALGVARGLEQLGAQPSVKWPNDVWIGEGKVAGLLLEMTAESDAVNWVVAGIGLNVLAPPRRQTGAAYLDDHVAGVTPARAAAAVLDSVAESYSAWCEERFVGMRDEFDRRHRLTGQHVAVRSADGRIEAEGVVDSVDSEGRLMLRTSQGMRGVVAGEVTLKAE